MDQATLAAAPDFWPNRSPELRQYYASEWGVASHDDRYLFELLVLEIMAAGLSWQLALRKRAGINAAFADMDVDRIAAFGTADVERLLQDERIMRNRRKVTAVITNAQATQRLIAEWGSLDAYVWHFTGGCQQVGHWQDYHDLPRRSALAETVSRDLKQRGFTFVGPVLIHNYLQGAGVIDNRVDTSG
ncbi:DNA-3-methyladenine glycosylase I [Lacticaseibacillus thailandensis]|uniref:3-methyladenine DNA glycosylase n=1 Tax=Lacticaseibacillus thailandensis DSM 22698 = JCM 13996 TaxID=1423810 RepID=A0A0R2C7J2_9LACO|nr:DNA-3-methyladenine glycosylase I [Lacticaseibacillus thailandensis]KRM87608.1 3-methyladenine DNA glycosylase [Lacticaseibacillus thailandensis DSM 22698 = JCM 13996]